MTKYYAPDYAQAVAKHIADLSRLLVEQVQEAGGWPTSFIFPEPTIDAEREALALFVGELEKETGKPVRYATAPGRA